MTATLPERRQYLPLDGRELELLITVDLDGIVKIQHQAGDNDRANKAMARLAAEIDDQLLADDAPTHIVRPPAPGLDVLMCRCGTAVHAPDLRWIGNARNSIRRVGCAECAEQVGTW